MRDHKSEPVVSGQGYDQLVDRLVERLNETNELSAEKVQQTIDEVVELEQVALDMSKDEAALVKAYLMRDVGSLVAIADDAVDSISTWLKFDLELLEQSVARRLLSVADKSVVDMELLREQLSHGEAEYVSGELALPGTLVCAQCATEVQLMASVSIEPCQNCGGKLFTRASE
jgi:hypothetical protein